MRTYMHNRKSVQQTALPTPKAKQAVFGQGRKTGDVLHLQRTIGNHTVQRLLQTRAKDDLVIHGNPGRFIGLDARLIAQPEGPPRIVHFQVVEAIPGTWLSSVTKALGWDRKFSKAEGYGAYVEGVVFPLNRRRFRAFDPQRETFHPDRIKPGQRFLVLLPEQPASGFSTKRRDGANVKDDDLPDENEVLEEPSIDIADKLDKTARIFELMSDIDTFLEVSGAAGATIGALGLIGGVVSIFTGMAAGGRANSLTAVTARLRSQCYATTATIFNDRGNQISQAYSWDVIKVWSEFVEAKDAWNSAWKETTKHYEMWLDDMHASISSKYRAQHKLVPTKSKLIEALRQKAGGSSTKFCDQLMTSETIKDQLKNTIEKMLWDSQVNSVHYPN